ncbi:MAG: GGDEF domain-containing protein [Planctomycetes bacterium]|nr:GGDEF domain-containing protein [Planctomycetota bacterium]
MARKTGIFVLALALVALFGWLDHVTGADVRSVLFYFVPIMLVAMTLGRRAVVAVAIASAAAWGTAEILIRGSDITLALIWNESSALVVFMLVGLAISTLRRERHELKRANARIRQMLESEERLARTDALTGLPNSREFLERLTPELARCQRDGTPLCLLYFDIDNFKRVNDRHGHLEGDAVLKRVAEVLRKQLRASDVPARLGGDEFAALLWQTTADDAAAIGKRIVDSIVAIADNYAGSDLGASVGVIWFENPPSDVNEVVKRADDAMYNAKKTGKRKTVLVRSGVEASADAAK